MSSRCSASRAPATICSSLIWASSCGSPVRTTCAVPPPARGSGRVALAHPLGELDLGGVDVRDRDVAQLAVGVGEVDRAPVGEVAHAQLGDRGQRALHVQRCVERRAHVGQEAHPPQRGALVVDLARDADDRRAGRLVGHQAPARVVASACCRRATRRAGRACSWRRRAPWRRPPRAGRRGRRGARTPRKASKVAGGSPAPVSAATGPDQRTSPLATSRWKTTAQAASSTSASSSPLRSCAAPVVSVGIVSASCAARLPRRTPGIAGVPGPMARSVQRRTATARPARAGRARR